MTSLANQEWRRLQKIRELNRYNISFSFSIQRPEAGTTDHVRLPKLSEVVSA